MIPTTRDVEKAAHLSLGDKFYYPSWTTEYYEATCDWCAGDYQHKTPTGKFLECDHCTKGKATQYRHQVPEVKEYTVGMITLILTHKGVKLKIMASETGVGSGSVYNWGDTAFLSKLDAMAAAEARVAELNEGS